MDIKLKRYYVKVVRVNKKKTEGLNNVGIFVRVRILMILKMI